jgi:hypothetical protein
MTENDHDDLSYNGTAGETVTVIVQAQNTNQMVVHSLKGAADAPWPASGTLQFNLDPGLNRLRLTMDCNEENASHTVTVRTVQNEANNECVHVWACGENPVQANFRFFV